MPTRERSRAQFGATRLDGVLYIELRTATRSEAIGDRKDEPRGCVLAELGRELPAGFEVNPVRSGRRVLGRRVARDLVGGAVCEPLPRGQPNFIID